eukprot:4536292-Pyramimonas_sp.AAC.1
MPMPAWAADGPADHQEEQPRGACRAPRCPAPPWASEMRTASPRARKERRYRSLVSRRTGSAAKSA